jgi:hypothetical protein
MHTLHTTDAFILGSYEHGEASRVYKLFTKEKGMLYAHAQSVREQRNKNRYALRTHARVQVTLVRGRETWRITSVQEHGHTAERCFVEPLCFVGNMLPREVAEENLFADIAGFYEALVHGFFSEEEKLFWEHVMLSRSAVALGYCDAQEGTGEHALLSRVGVYTKALYMQYVHCLPQIRSFVRQYFSAV